MGGGAAGPYQGSHSEGTISMNISLTNPTTTANPANPYGFYNAAPAPANVSGLLTLSQTVVSDLQVELSSGYSGYGTGYNPYYPSAIPTPTVAAASLCVNQMGLSLGVASSYQGGTAGSGYIYGNVYLYINNVAYQFYL